MAHSPANREKDSSTAIQAASPQSLSKRDLMAEISSFTESRYWTLDGLLARPVTILRNNATVFLTGANGYLGIEILGQLLRSDRIKKVVVLIRARDVQHGISRIKKSAQIAEWWRPGDESKVEVWLGDLSKDGMGLDQEQMIRLRGGSINHDNNIDAIIHNGALVNWITNYDTLRAPNIMSTVELLRITASSSVPIKFIYISGGLKRNMQESVTTFAAKLINQSGYAQTKFVSERIVADIASRLPIGQNRISVVKPGFIIGNANTGVANINDFLWRMVATTVNLRQRSALYKYPVDPAKSWLYLVKVDTVAVQVTDQLLSEGEITPFIDMRAGVFMSRFWELVYQELELPCSPIPWDDWVQDIMAEIDEIGIYHPMYALEFYLSNQNIYPEPPELCSEGSHNIVLALRKNVRYLQQVGFIQTSADGIERYKGKAFGRSDMI